MIHDTWAHEICHPPTLSIPIHPLAHNAIGRSNKQSLGTNEPILFRPVINFTYLQLGLLTAKCESHNFNFFHFLDKLHLVPKNNKKG